MKHCSQCDIDVDNSYNLCPYCGRELRRLDQKNVCNTTYQQGEAAHHTTSTRPEREIEFVFEETDRHSVKINGMVVECTTQQYYQSKLTKIVQSVFYGEPYQLSHTTFVTVFRVQEHVLRGFAEQARDIIVYGNIQSVLSTGDDVTIVAKSSGGRYIARSIYNHSINSTVTVQAGLLPAWLIRLLVIVPVGILAALICSILSTPSTEIINGILLIVTRCWPLIALAFGWKWLVNKLKKK